MVTDFLHVDPNATPVAPLPVAADVAAKLRVPAASGLRVTWLGHSTSLLEIGHTRVLTDPNWSERATPIRRSRNGASVAARRAIISSSTLSC